jgi:hypothetical protein
MQMGSRKLGATHVVAGQASGSRTEITIWSETLMPAELVTVNVRLTISSQSQADGEVKVVVGECAFSKNPNPPSAVHR